MMKTKEIINGPGKKELLKWKLELESILGESNWKLIKVERALALHQTNLQECAERLESERKRADETRTAMGFLSETHSLKQKCEDDLYRTEIRIFRLENKLKRFSILKPIQLEIKKLVLAREIKYYENVLQEIEKLLLPPVVLHKVSNKPDVDTEKNIFQLIPQPVREAMDGFEVVRLRPMNREDLVAQLFETHG